MPLVITCDELKPGMLLCESFIWRDRMMVTGNSPLTPREVSSLQARFPEQRFRILDPLLEEAVEFEDDSHERKVAHTAQQKIAKCMNQVQTRFSEQSSLDDACVATLQAAVLDVVKYLEDHPVSAALVENLVGTHGYLGERAGNVFYLSMTLGTTARHYVADERRRQSTARELDPKMLRNLLPLGLGSILMDMGMLPLAYLFTDSDPLTPENWEAVRDHPVAGAAMLPDHISPTVKTMVRTHHENFDGTGYPMGLDGERLHVCARIVRIADAYDAATATNVYKQAKSSVRALWEMSVGPYARCYDPKLMRIFARLIQPFPIGSKIKLSNGQHAVVVKYNRMDPMAPLVVVAFDAHNRRIRNADLPPPMRLGSHPDLCVAAFCGEDMSYLYEPPGDPPARSPIGIWPSLFQAAYP